MKFGKMPVGEIFAPEGEKFEFIAIRKKDMWFIKKDAKHAVEILDMFEETEREGLIPVYVGPDEEYPCSWEP